jgi:hypothetical protein
VPLFFPVECLAKIKRLSMDLGRSVGVPLFDN